MLLNSPLWVFALAVLITWIAAKQDSLESEVSKGLVASDPFASELRPAESHTVSMARIRRAAPNDNNYLAYGKRKKRKRKPRGSPKRQVNRGKPKRKMRQRRPPSKRTAPPGSLPKTKLRLKPPPHPHSRKKTPHGPVKKEKPPGPVKKKASPGPTMKKSPRKGPMKKKLTKRPKASRRALPVGGPVAASIPNVIRNISQRQCNKPRISRRRGLIPNPNKGRKRCGHHRRMEGNENKEAATAGGMPPLIMCEPSCGKKVCRYHCSYPAVDNAGQNK